MKLLDSMKGKLLLIILCTLFSIKVSALTFEVNGVYYTAISETEVKVVYNPVTGYSGNIIIAEEVTYDDMTFAVTSIAENAFQDSLMISVTIPKSVISIHEWAFVSCYGLQSVIVAADNPNYCSVNGALYNKAKTELRYCPAATTGRFDVEEGVTDILAPAFIDCRNVTIIGIPASTNNIQISFVRIGGSFGGTPFNIYGSTFNYPALQKFDISSENQSFHFENGVLYNKDVTSILKVLGSVPETIELPEGLAIISSDSFRRKFNLKKIVFPSSLTGIGDGAFYNCTNLETVSFEKCDKLEYIGDNAFYACFNLKDVSFDKCIKLEHVGINAFSDVPLNSVIIPKWIREIGDRAFCGTKELILSDGLTAFDFHIICSDYIETIHLPSSIKNIKLLESGWSIKNLKTLTIEPGGDFKTVNNVLFNSDMTHLYMCAPKGVVGEYTIPSSVTSISDNAFLSNSTITKLAIPGSVKTIPNSMFHSLSGIPNNKLRTLIIEEGVEEIKDFAFYGNALKSLSLPSSLKTVESYWSFHSQNKILEVYSFSDSFNDTFKLSQAGISRIGVLHTKEEPSNIKQTEDGFVYYMDSDTPVLADYEGESKDAVMPETIEGKNYQISDCCFYANKNIETLTLPNSKSLAEFPGENSFMHCINLKKVIIPEGTTAGDIKLNIFNNIRPEILLSPANKNLVYENNILYNGDKSKLIFHNNFSDNTLKIPDCVTEICEYALYDDGHVNNINVRHNNLKSITFSSGSAIVNQNSIMLMSCEDLIIPDNLTLKSGSIRLERGNIDTDHGYIELGAGYYEPNSIQWHNVEQIHSMVLLNQNEWTYANIKCNFKDPDKINCPFVMNPSNQYDVTNIAILNVPYGTKEKFQNAPGWGNFKKIVENFEYVATKHQLTYMLDGEVYKQVSIEVGAEISAIPSPQKEGYQFSGWIDLPETMGNEDVVVNGYFYKLGDVNSDTRINVADIDETVDLILGAMDIKKQLAADVNGDKVVNVGDINGIANYIQKGSFTVANAASRRASLKNTPRLTFTTTSVAIRGEAIMEVCLDNSADDITSLQFDLSMPEGLRLNTDAGIIAVADRSDGHQLSWARQDNGTIRVVFYSAANNQFKKSSGASLRLNIAADNLAEGEYQIDVDNIVMVSYMGDLYDSNTTGLVNVLGTTDIRTIDTEDSKPAVIYDINGRKLNSPKKGLNVINGQKVIVK